MSDHKAYCNCATCRRARELEQKGKIRRPLPKHVINEIQEKSAKKEQDMLDRGFILLECPICQHRTFMKIRPIITCPCCCAEIK